MKKIRIIQAAILIAFVSILASCSSSYYPYRWYLCFIDRYFRAFILCNKILRMDVIIIVARRDMFIGEVMITGTIWTEHT